MCDKTLPDHGINCDINTVTVQRPDQKWISTMYTHLNSSQSQQQGMLVHDHCPFDYCTSTNGSEAHAYEAQSYAIHILVVTPVQGCLWLHDCMLCIILQALIVLKQLHRGTIVLHCSSRNGSRVSVGTINGLTFYANIVRANHAVFFHTICPLLFSAHS